MDPLLRSARPAGTATVGRYARTVVLYPFSFFDLVTWKWYRGGWRDIYL
jgi:hypothetical protein